MVFDIKRFFEDDNNYCTNKKNVGFEALFIGSVVKEWMDSDE